jgi:hypothetical protein
MQQLECSMREENLIRGLERYTIGISGTKEQGTELPWETTFFILYAVNN